MKFRKLYWVTEQIGNDGASEIAGVYTSIPDLTERGLQWKDGLDRRQAFRLTLVALDSTKKPLCGWTLPEIGSLSTDLQPFVDTQEFTSMDVEILTEALQGFMANV